MMKVKEGDLDKLALLFERYNQKLFHFFYRLTHRRDISEDLVQSVFERILKYRKSYNNGGSFAAWIFQIARNLHADHYRNIQKSEKLTTYMDWDGLEDNGLETDNGFQQEEELKWLQQALDQLDEVKKQTLILSRFQGFRYSEIANIMNCSESAVKVRIFRALHELEARVKELKRKSL